MAQPKSSTLFHFTKSVDVVQSILKNSFYPRLSLEDVTWLGIPKLEYFAYPMVCFCDIPLGRIEEHVNFYGAYGVGLSREWAIKNGLNPVFYLSKSSPLVGNFLTSMRAAIEADKPKKPEDRTSRQLHTIMAHMKPLDGTMVVAGSPVSKEFYLENEWRYVPRLDDQPIALVKEQYDDDAVRNPYNDELKAKAPLGFSPEDVRYVFVKSDADIPPLVDFMNSQLGHLSVAAMKILITRITSLEHIAKDV